MIAHPILLCERASVAHSNLEETGDNTRVAKIVLKDISISYRQSVSGAVDDVRVEDSQRQIRVGGHWYHGEKPGVDIFNSTVTGSVVQLVTFGCAGNEKACLAIPAETK